MQPFHFLLIENIYYMFQILVIKRHLTSFLHKLKILHTSVPNSNSYKDVILSAKIYILLTIIIENQITHAPMCKMYHCSDTR